VFMLTHTYFLQQVVETAGGKSIEPDSYVYNIAPDLLTLSPNISANRTHAIGRNITIPSVFAKAAFVFFHLFVDDLVHYGHVCDEMQEGFDADSEGYCYLKGRRLVDAIIELHRLLNREISRNEAAYQSHLIIEMIYDLVITRQIHENRTIEILVDALRYTAEKKLDEFAAVMHWMYGLEKQQIAEVLKTASLFLTKERMADLMTMNGRIILYQDKFGLKSDSVLFSQAVKKLFDRALNSITDEDGLCRRAVSAMDELRRCGADLDGLLHGS